MNSTNMILSSNGFNEDILNNLAKDVGLMQRKRLLTGYNLFWLLLQMVRIDVASYNSLANALLSGFKVSISKQGLHKVMVSKKFKLFFDSVVQLFMEHSFVKYKTKYGFNNILIQDSTVIQMHKSLFNYYSGATNKTNKSSANCRIQFAFELIQHTFQLINLNPYTYNDQKATEDLNVKKGDLVIRDRGYFTKVGLYRIKDLGAHFITRFLNNSSYYNEEGKKIEILKMLNKSEQTSFKVRIGSPTNALVYLIAASVRQEIANQRRAKNKEDEKRRNRSKKSSTLALMSWTIYLTTLNPEEYTFKQIHELYSLRWRIEIMFKGLKSYLNLNNVHKVPKEQFELITRARFLSALILTEEVFMPLSMDNKVINNQTEISLLLIFKNVGKLMEKINEIIIAVKKKNKDCALYNGLIKLCKHCKRKKRTNQQKYIKSVVYA